MAHNPAQPSPSSSPAGRTLHPQLLRVRRALLRAADMHQVGQWVLEAAAALGQQVVLLWSAGTEVKVAPDSALSPAHLQAVFERLAVPAARAPVELQPDQFWWLLPLCGVTSGVPAAPWAVLLVRQSSELAGATELPAMAALLRVLRTCMPGALKTEQLCLKVERLEAAERLQQALYAIADLASAELDMPELLQGIHKIVAGLMYAENMFIVLYDADRRSLRFLYFVDSKDPDAPSPETEFLETELEQSLTVAMVRRGRALMGPSALLSRELGLPSLDALGPDSEDWLGVPLLSGNQVRGGIVVQSYDPRIRFSERDRSLLGYVAQHILPTLERKQHQAELELRVEQRTQQLRSEVRERERGERLQRALFRIAELSSENHSLAEFFGAVHAIISELLYARNFFIALLNEEGTGLSFPYAVDEKDDEFVSRELRRGMTEYVLRTGQPLLAMPADSARLIAAGEVLRIGPMSACWLGVPLIHRDRSLGVLVMQSYTPSVVYSPADQELLTFVSFHICNALERKQAQEELRRANAELNATLQRLRQTQRQLVESEKMASLGGLVAGVAHEINTPLGISLTAASHLSEEAARLHRRLQSGELRRAELDGFGHSVLEASDLIVRNLQRADQLVRSFKQVAVDQSVNEPRQVELGAAVADILKMLAPALRRSSHKVELECPEPVSLMLPGGVLYQIVSNLVMNAIQHAFLPEQQGLISLGVRREGPEVVLACRDNGVGMNEAVRKQIFEPFFTTRRGQGGTGLGLHIVYNLVSQALQGSVRCESAPGAGSCFELRWRAPG